MEEQTKIPYLKPALIYGAIYGFVGVLVGVIFYVLNLQFKSWTQLVNLAVSILILVYCLKAYRDEYLGGFASYGRLMLMVIGIAVIAVIISTIYSYVLTHVIDPEFMEKAKQYQIDRFSNNPRISEAQLEAMIDRMDRKSTPGRMLWIGVISGIVMNLILGLIISAFLKKEETPTDMVM
jgi:hypothetical protein